MSQTTYHAIDEPVLISPAEIMLYFTEAFVFPLLLSNVSEDGRECRFRIYQHASGEAYLKRANRIIAVLRMPLEAVLKIGEVGGFVYETTLIVKYTGK